MNFEQSILNIEPGNFKSVIELPYSKSYANRALAIASIVKGPFKIKNIATSSDVTTMIKTLREIGLEIEVTKTIITVKNSFPECEKNSSEVVKLDTGDGGTTNRILLGVLSLGKNTYELNSTEKFKDRPNHEAFKVLKQLGVKCEGPAVDDRFWIRLTGPVKEPENIEVDCSDTTQFYTGFKILELVKNINFTAKNLNTSARYVDITRHLVEKVKSGSKEVEIPVDFSSASYPIVFGAVKNKVLIKNCLHIDQLQADSCVIDLINKIGGKVEISPNGLLITPSRLRPFDHDCSGCPDLVPSLVFLALNISGKSRLKNLSVLRHKESDRISEILKIIDTIGANGLYNEDRDELIIEGKFNINQSVDFDLPSDHRMIILASMLLRVGHMAGSVNNFSHVNKSYPEFFLHLQGE